MTSLLKKEISWWKDFFSYTVCMIGLCLLNIGIITIFLSISDIPIIYAGQYLILGILLIAVGIYIVYWDSKYYNKIKLV